MYDIKYIFRKVFYHWRQKYICRFGWHCIPIWMHGNDVRYMSYCCTWCGKMIDNTKHMHPKCLKDGHNWKMQHDGWTTNPKWDIDNLDPMKDMRRDRKGNFMTKKNIYYKCARCGAHGYNEKHP